MSIVKYFVLEWNTHCKEWRPSIIASSVFDRTMYNSEADGWEAVKKEKTKDWRKDDEFSVCAILVPEPIPMPDAGVSLVLANNGTDLSTVIRGTETYQVLNSRTRLGATTLGSMGFHQFPDGHWYKKLPALSTSNGQANDLAKAL